MSYERNISEKRRELSQPSFPDPLSPKRIRRDSTSDIINPSNCLIAETSTSSGLDVISLETADDQTTFSSSSIVAQRDNDTSRSSLSSTRSDLASLVSFKSNAKTGADVYDVASPTLETQDQSHALGTQNSDEDTTQKEYFPKAGYTALKRAEVHSPSHEYNKTFKFRDASEGGSYRGSARLTDHPSNSQHQKPAETTTQQQPTAITQVSNSLPIPWRFEQNESKIKSRKALPCLRLVPVSTNERQSDQDQHHMPTASAYLGEGDLVQSVTFVGSQPHAYPQIGTSLPYSYGVVAASTFKQEAAVQITQNKHAMTHIALGLQQGIPVSRPVFNLGTKHPSYRFEAHALNASRNTGEQSILPRHAVDSQGLASAIPAQSSDKSDTGRPPLLPLPVLCGNPGSPASQWPQLYAVTFTLDNRAESRLSSSKVTTLMDIITRLASIVVSSKHASVRKSSYSVSAIFWSCLGDFREWYLRVNQVTGVEDLHFQFPEAEFTSSKAFILSLASTQSFCDLKQKLWDTFWTTYHSRSSKISSFPVLISPYTDSQTTLGSISAQMLPPRITCNSKYTSPPQNRSTKTILGQAPLLDGMASARVWSPPAIGSPSSTNTSPSATVHKPMNQTAVSEEQTRIAISISESPRFSLSSKGINGHTVASPETPAVDITLRLQTDAAGRFSSEYDKAYLRPSVTTEGFFRWFSSQTGYLTPNGPSSLKFTMMHAMPIIKEETVKRGNEEHFTYLRKEIKAQFAKAKEFLPGLKEFVVLIKVAGWAEDEMNDVW